MALFHANRPVLDSRGKSAPTAQTTKQKVLESAQAASVRSRQARQRALYNACNTAAQKAADNFGKGDR